MVTLNGSSIIRIIQTDTITSRLRIHPTQEWFDIYQPLANDDLQRFLDYFLLDRKNGWESTPKVRLSLLRYNKAPISFRAEDRYPPSRMEYKTFYLNATRESKGVAGSLQAEAPTDIFSTSYQSDSWEDDGSYFKLTFTEPVELIGSSQVRKIDFRALIITGYWLILYTGQTSYVLRLFG